MGELPFEPPLLLFHRKRLVIFENVFRNLLRLEKEMVGASRRLGAQC